ncbi:MAG TPA: trehalose-6-phosphate synthase [Terriglobales bacterium]|nr:trehalose-6-phosphate synthase [Terriglobales bacterium]
MRLLSLRLIGSLILGITLVSLLSSYFEVTSEIRGQRRELERRAEVLGESLAENIEPYFEKGSRRELQRIVERFGNRQHLSGIAIYNKQGDPIAITSGLLQQFSHAPAVIAMAEAEDRGVGEFLALRETSVHAYALPLHQNGEVAGGLAIVHDAAYIGAQSRRVWRETFFRILEEMVIIVLATLLIVRWTLNRPIARAVQWMRALRTGRVSPPAVPDWELFRPLAAEMTTFAESLIHARSAAENEARLRDAAESTWTAERLAVHVRGKLGEGRLFVLSNREPYTHTHQGNSVQVIVPASGVVTALEPVLRACDGTWIAHGNGDADAEVVDQNDRLRVPPEDPRYTLRRVWLSKAQEEGYYYGFANEGLWPLCHIAHARPLFRASDWEHYQEVNRKFADAVLEEMDGVEKPVILVQDYHFALVPRLIKEKRPDARVAIFWHIPWPNPEAFGICPWQRQLLDGLLGADLIGLHVQSHCNNFLQTVDRALESRIDWEHFSVKRNDHFTMVRPFPISVDFEDFNAEHAAAIDAYTDRAALLKEQGAEAIFMGVGVDRLDYTKGILERFLAVERLMERYPEYQGQFTFVQVGAPSRTHIKRYHDFLGEVEAEVDRINWRFQSSRWKPIVFLKRQHNHREIQRYYRAADVCLVTSLHDGMNLVAKEFLAARNDEQGALILSWFTGAARELRDALLVNPYDIDQTAEAIRFALEMDPEDRKLRMQRMRKIVRENNVYRWAGNLIGELCDIRVDRPVKVRERSPLGLPVVYQPHSLDEGGLIA